MRRTGLKERRRNNVRRRLYGFNTVELEQFLALQNGRCATCHQPISLAGRKATACVDHCHRTHRVRGILCKQCNVALGMVKENPEVLRALIAYLQIHG